MRTGNPHWSGPDRADWWERRAEWARHPRRRGPSPGLAVIVGLIQVFSARGAAGNQPGALDLDQLGYLLLLAGPAALLLRRRAPLPVLAVTVAATAAYELLGYPSGPVFLAAVVALFTAVRAGHRNPAGAIAAAGYLGYVGLGRLLPEVGGRALHPPTIAAAVVVALAAVVVTVAAETARVRGQQFAQAAQFRAERARARAEQERRQASEERLRIARELHDVLGHHLSLISVQAGVGLHLIDSRPDQARAALAAIKTASAEALREVRSVLGVLQADGEVAPRAPAPGLDRLAELTEDGGLTVRTETLGAARPLPPEVDRAAYRIVQEALTNVRRHARAGATATVTVGYDAGQLRLRVDDDGASPTTEVAADGNGIAGMRARAVALGGSLRAGPVPGAGFRVEAVLPTGADGPLPAGVEPADAELAGAELAGAEPAGAEPAGTRPASAGGPAAVGQPVSAPPAGTEPAA